MFNEHALEKSVCLSSEGEVDALCKYLNDCFGIKHFQYIKIFKDNTCIFLTTHSAWTKVFYQDFYQYGTHHKEIDSLTSGVVLWSTHTDQTVFKAFREFSGIDHGISLRKKCEDFCEIFAFASDCGHPQIVDFYINNLDLLWRHALYFKDQAKELIQLANKDRLILPKVLAAPKDELIPDRAKINELVITNTPLAKYYQSQEIMQLTTRQRECLYFLTKGKTTKEIARAMKLSPRTVEEHINIIKDKLNCRYKSEVINRAMQTGFSQDYEAIMI